MLQKMIPDVFQHVTKFLDPKSAHNATVTNTAHISKLKNIAFRHFKEKLEELKNRTLGRIISFENQKSLLKEFKDLVRELNEHFCYFRPIILRDVKKRNKMRIEVQKMIIIFLKCSKELVKGNNLLNMIVQTSSFRHWKEVVDECAALAPTIFPIFLVWCKMFNLSNLNNKIEFILDYNK